MYKWIDSCCIDKSSSAELSEAINSMYKWYANAQVCYAYLSDVDVDQNAESALRLSQWFSRGWTLQELLAPRVVQFYDKNWLEIGTKQSLSWLLAEITGIGSGSLSGDKVLTCIAQKMSWAARRKTTRAEDLAYCLMGLFDVNMPLLYGEGGQKAFIRLQTEIMATTTDESIFAWSYPETALRRYFPLVAEHPSWFTNSGRHYLPFREMLIKRGSTHQMTSRGVRIEALRIPSMEIKEKLTWPEEDGFLMPLNSRRMVPYTDGHYNILAIPMIRTIGLQGNFFTDTWCRLPNLELIKIHKEHVKIFQDKDKSIIIHVPQSEVLLKPLSRPLNIQARILIRTGSLAEYGFTLIDDNGWSYEDGEPGLQFLGQNAQGDLILENPGFKDPPVAKYWFLFSNGSVKFALLVYLRIQLSCDLQSGVEQDLDDKLEEGHLTKPATPFWISRTDNQDRCSYCLKENFYVSASLRLGRESGNLVNVVDVTIGTRELWVKGMRAQV
jgi:hypothetical protein